MDAAHPDRNPLWPEPGPGARCEGCAWRYEGGRGKPVSRCRRHQDARVDGGWPACPAFTEALDCQTCAACCREAYHTVEVSRRDPFARAHRGLLVEEFGRLNLRRREDGRCPCLEGAPGAWSCDRYEERPRTCRDFEQGSASCLWARRRLGLTL